MKNGNISKTMLQCNLAILWLLLSVKRLTVPWAKKRKENVFKIYIKSYL